MKNNADVNAKDTKGITPLVSAVAGGYEITGDYTEAESYYRKITQIESLSSENAYFLKASEYFEIDPEDLSDEFADLPAADFENINIIIDTDMSKDDVSSFAPLGLL